MYYYFFGELAVLEQNFAVIDCGGVGYRLGISLNTYKFLTKHKIGERVKLFSYLSVREDAQDLFGFYSDEEKNAYLLLTGVSGVGPKAALAILSELTYDKVALAVATGDSKAFTRASGVGPKLAQRIVLELKDKIKNEQLISGAESFEDVYIPTGSAKSEAVTALAVLGYSRSEAQAAVNRAGLPDSATVEENIKAALSQLMKNI